MSSDRLSHARRLACIWMRLQVFTIIPNTNHDGISTDPPIDCYVHYNDSGGLDKHGEGYRPG